MHWILEDDVMTASELWESAQTVAKVLPAGASVTLGAALPVETVRELAALMGRPVHHQRYEPLIWDSDKRPRIIEAAECVVDGVQIRAQGSRPMVAADLEAA